VVVVSQVARERIVLPQLERGLITLGDHAETKDWAALYRVTCRELIAAFDEEYNHQRQASASDLLKTLDSNQNEAQEGGAAAAVEGATSDASPASTRMTTTTTLEERCVGLAVGRGHDLVLTEDGWLLNEDELLPSPIKEGASAASTSSSSSSATERSTAGALEVRDASEAKKKFNGERRGYASMLRFPTAKEVARVAELGTSSGAREK
jgi:hypothetical protein